jgi:hypothetical protein
MGYKPQVSDAVIVALPVDVVDLEGIRWGRAVVQQPYQPMGLGITTLLALIA